MVNLTNPVKYHALNDHLHPADLPPVAWLYDYVIAKNGTFKRASNQYLEACLKTAILADNEYMSHELYHAFYRLKIPRLPVSAMEIIIENARQSCADGFIETFYLIMANGAVIKPMQQGNAGRVSYDLGEIDPDSILMEVHTHPGMAYFSETDNADEQGFRLYGVLGNINQARPEFCLRIGAYGDFGEKILAWDIFEDSITDVIQLTKDYYDVAVTK